MDGRVIPGQPHSRLAQKIAMIAMIDHMNLQFSMALQAAVCPEM